MNNQKQFNKDIQLDEKLVHARFLRRENDSPHHSYDQELYSLQLLKEGNMECVDIFCSTFTSQQVGRLSDNPVRNYQYLFIASVTLATRFAIEGGLEPEEAYNLSDQYIQTMDHYVKVEQIYQLERKMLTDFVSRVKLAKEESTYTKPILLCMDHIYNNLHKQISLISLSNIVHLSPSYLSTLFKKETGKSISFYIKSKRIETAKNMLKFSDYTCLEISNYLTYSSHSHFINVFKKDTGYTPKEYRNKFFRQNWI